MRISDLSTVTDIPLSTLKDLRHRKILELAMANHTSQDLEVRQWGHFSMPDAIILIAAKKVRSSYGMAWDDAVTFAANALRQVREPLEGHPVSAKFFDLGAVDKTIWVGRFDFPGIVESSDWPWNYFACEAHQIGRAHDRIEERLDQQLSNGNAKIEPGAVGDGAEACVMINASSVVDEYKQRVRDGGIAVA